MKNGIIVALIAAIAIGSALGAFAATRTVQTEVAVEVKVWESARTGNLYLSTRPDGGEWTTHNTPLDMVLTGNFYESSSVLVTVPVEIEVEVPDAAEPTEEPTEEPTPEPTPEPTATPEPEPGTCCEVRGMDSLPAAHEAVVEEMQAVIAFADRQYQLEHSGPITINISFTNSGLTVRYWEAFGERLTVEELPSTCSFQRGEHVFFGPQCRADKRAYAREWIQLALGTNDQNPEWIEHGTFDYFVSHYLNGRTPELEQDRFQRVVFFEESKDLRAGYAGEELMSLGVVWATNEYRGYRNWLGFYRSAVASGDAAAAFEEAFDTSLTRYYDIFETWAESRKAVLQATAFQSCEEASRNLRLQAGEDDSDPGYPDYRVPLEPDHDGDGLVCEGYFPQ